MKSTENHRQFTDIPELKKLVSHITNRLPIIEHHSRSNGEIDYYGASYCISKLLGLSKPLFSRSTWLHCWMWFNVMDPEQIVYKEFMGHTNLVRSKEQEIFLKENGFYKAIAVGLPFLYPDVVDIQRIPNSLLVYPMHTTQCTTLTIHEQTHEYIEYIKQLREHFSLVVASIGYEDVRRGNWIAAFEKAGIPWIAGAWSHDKNALTRMHYLMRQFEFVTSNSPGSHCVYAAYCGCKVSFTGPKDRLIKAELDTHPHYKKYPHIASAMKKRDLVEEFQAKFPALCVEPKNATVQTDWAWKELGGEHKKKPEEIAELFEWKLRKLPSGRWTAINPHDLLTNDELFAKATAKSIVGQHDEAFKLTNMLKRRHVRLKDVEIIRARYFLHNNNTHAAREALKEELRHFPDNTEASRLFQELGGDALTPHKAKNKGEQEFITMLNTVRPFTRLNFKRAKSLYTLALRICQENIPGNFVECGVAAGGSTMLLALVVQKHSKIPRKVFAFDTFTGMPDPGEADAANGVPADDTGWGTGTCAAPEEFVQAKCRQLGVGDLVETRKGLFDATLPEHRAGIGQIALLHMDADWYSSTMTILDNLFDQLNDRALIQIDDYGAWDGCKKAILDYSTQHDLFFDVQDIDGTGVWCAKPAQAKRPAVSPAPPCDEAFLSPRLSPGFADLYLLRKNILERLEQTILNFSGVLLDVGCGQMPYREHILTKNPNITHYLGLDFPQGKYADLRQPDLTWDGNTIPLPDSTVDCAMATEVLAHCHNPLSVLKEIHRVLKPSGIFFFTVPFLWPIHDAPHDHYRYTPFAMQKLLSDAGFEEVLIEALGGWNASLAQMIGLWLKRAPMSEAARKQATTDLLPFYEQLTKTDVIPTDFNKNPMITGLSGLARAARGHQARLPENNLTKTVVVTDQFPILSQTFILDQITGLIDRGLGVEHWSLQRMDEPVVHENVSKYGLLDATRYISLPPDSLRADPKRWTEQFLRSNGLSSLADVAAVQIHFGPNFNKLEPLFATYPDLFVLVSFHGYDGSATFKVKGADVYARLFARANQITTPSQHMKNNLIQYGCPPDKIVVHHYGKDTTTFAPAPRPESRPVRLLSVARFVEKKGLEYSLRAFAKAQTGFDVEYRIVGYGPLEQEFKALVKSLGMTGQVRFLGQLTNDAVRQEMATADIFVLTSVTASNGDEEGVPVSLIEAHALGLPVVSSRHAGIPELVAHGETGFLAEERDVEEIAGFMRVMIKNPAIRKAFSASARERVLREFDLAKLNNTLAERLLRRGAVPDQTEQVVRQEDAVSASGEAHHPAAVYCPICRTEHIHFRPFGKPPRPNAMCPNCTSLERHRAIWLFLERHTDFFASPRLRMLHFAPETCLEPRFRLLMGKGYVTADLLNPRADVQADITNLQFPDASFDAVLCSHVLEHVPDDLKAMHELHRVLDKDGIALIMVPLRGAVTVEDLSVTDPKERTKRYGQSDHVRYYGMDIADRLQKAGFAVQCINSTAICSPHDFANMRLSNEQIFLCRKQSRAKKADTDETATVRDTTEAPPKTTAQDLSVTTRHWSTSKTAPRTRWWMHPAILRHINTLVCGNPVDGPWAGLEWRMRRLVNGDSFARGVSIGCDSASKELRLLQEGIVGHFDLFEISPERVALGQTSATRHGVAERASFYVRDAFAQDLGDQYDLVYWNNALHHMLDVHQALLWSRERLRPGGWLVMDDYVGATRFQWPDTQLEIASRVRRSLPERLLRNPTQPKRTCSTSIKRPGLAGMLAADPSEASDSGNILPALSQIFPDAQILLTGGVVYNLALKDIIANFGDTDADRLQALLDYDAELATQGQTQYACAFASKEAIC